MFKKISLLLLAMSSSSYAMESIPTTPTGNNNIKQTTEEVKNDNKINNTTKTNTQDVTLTKTINIGNKNVEDVKQVSEDNKNIVKNITNELNALKIDKTVQQLNSINVDRNDKVDNKVNINDKTKATNNTKTLKNKELKQNIKNDDVNRSTSKEEVFNAIESLSGEKCNTINNYDYEADNYFKLYIDRLDDNKKDWFKLYTYDKFSRICQNFWQDVMQKNVITDQMMYNFCKTEIFCDCINAGLDPLTILRDEIKFNVDPICVMKSHLFQLKDRALYLSYMVTRHTKRIRYHRNKTQALQERLQTDDIKMVNKSYWDNYWRNYETLSKEY